MCPHHHKAPCMAAPSLKTAPPEAPSGDWWPRTSPITAAEFTCSLTPPVPPTFPIQIFRTAHPGGLAFPRHPLSTSVLPRGDARQETSGASSHMGGCLLAQHHLTYPADCAPGGSSPSFLPVPPAVSSKHCLSLPLALGRTPFTSLRNPFIWK